MKWHQADLLAMGQRCLSAKTNCHRPGGEGGLILERLPRRALVELPGWRHPPPLAAFVY